MKIGLIDLLASYIFTDTTLDDLKSKSNPQIHSNKA